ncbi:MAG: hypothetical protein K2X01_06930 [Cyanobacteria bacterium]|nr:hypothetical protein [Cyanobacteriota bacterium]
MQTVLTPSLGVNATSRKARFGNASLPSIPPLTGPEKTALIEATEGLIQQGKQDIRGFMLPQATLEQIWVICPNDHAVNAERENLKRSPKCNYNAKTGQITRDDGKPVFVTSYQNFLNLLRA